MLVPLDRQILQEIVRIVQTQQRVPTSVQVDGHQYALTYLDDHDRRLQDAIENRDSNLLGMLFGQLASRVKYQAIPAKVARAGRSPTGKSRPSAAGGKERQGKATKASPWAKRHGARESRVPKQGGGVRPAKKQAKSAVKGARRSAKKTK